MDPLWTGFAIISGGGMLLVVGRLLAGRDQATPFSTVLHRALGVGFFAALAGLVFAYFAHASFEVSASLALVSAAYVVGFVIPSPVLAHLWLAFSNKAQSTLGRIGISISLLAGIATASAMYLGFLETGEAKVELSDTSGDYLSEIQNQNGGQFEVAESPLYTDRGTTIAIKKAVLEQQLSVAVIERQTDMLRRFKLREQLIQVPCGWQPCNCHGFTFADGQFRIPGDEVPKILADNGYSPVASPRQGDVAVYRNDRGEVVHTGVVFAANRDVILVESKWGRLGRFIHPHNRHCYVESTCAFYRSARPGHTLHGVPHHEGTLYPDSNAPNFLDLMQPAHAENK